MRAVPTVVPPEVASLKRAEQRRLLQLTLKVVTPMFGGGAIPGVVDGDFPVNGKGVRGQLRFWWRACRASRCETTNQLFEEEAALWGQAAHKESSAMASSSGGGPRYQSSALDVVVDVLHGGDPYDPDSVPYALFPFRKQENRPKQWGQVGIQFMLTISAAPHVETHQYADLQREAEAAVWAWITFGGIGARTRRGCGSLLCLRDHIDSCWRPNDKKADSHRFTPSKNPKEWLAERSRRYVLRGPHRGRVPRLQDARCVVDTRTSDPESAWQRAVSCMRDYRQDPGYARQPVAGGSRRPGMSYWPDRATVYDALGMSDPRTTRPNAAIQGLPRAEFGLPILFQNMEHFDRRRGAPTLEATGDQASRMASPVIIKALPLSATDAVPLVIDLNVPRLSDPDYDLPGLRLKAITQPGSRVQGVIRTENSVLETPVPRSMTANAQDIPSYQPGRRLLLHDELSARDGFLRYVCEVWGQSGMLDLTREVDA